MTTGAVGVIVFDRDASADCARAASWADIRAADQSASPATKMAIASVFCIDVVGSKQ